MNVQADVARSEIPTRFFLGKGKRWIVQARALRRLALSTTIEGAKVAAVLAHFGRGERLVA